MVVLTAMFPKVRQSVSGVTEKVCEGMYPQSDGDLEIVHIDASKGFVDLWVHLTFAIFPNSDLKTQLKWLWTKI